MSLLVMECEPEWVELASRWHGGQNSMLYAVSSTGNLSRGTVRPTDRGVDYTDEEWDWSLLQELYWEVKEISEYVKPDDDDESQRDKQLAVEWCTAMQLLSKEDL